MAKHLKPEPFDRQLRDAFKVLDKDGTGFVVVSDLRHILTSIGEKLEPAEFDEWIREVDVGSDGKIRYEDFIARMVANVLVFASGAQFVAWILMCPVFGFEHFEAIAFYENLGELGFVAFGFRSNSTSSAETEPRHLRRRHGSKGISASALPYKRTPPSWLKISSQDIGVILRDSHGIAQVKSVTGSKILRILKAHGLAPEIPEDLYHLIKKAVAIRKHLERNRKDKDSKFRLILVESRIHRLARYYKKTKKLPPVWK
ncbi:UNVERIFIED_CONTAM: 40S ribosomal protein S13 [Sesamum calycinum]|uniref:40S ribosomal protein S13 n=1 Tax=Sesamum calycinum TaxID=2727403 RepID=A0AAW2QUG3_9LAMI